MEIFCLRRHPNDIKLFNGSLPLQLEQNIKRDCVNNNENFYWRNSFEFISRNKYPDNDEPLQRQILTRLCSEGQPDYEDPTPNILTMILGHSSRITMKRGMMCYQKLINMNLIFFNYRVPNNVTKTALI